MDQGSVVWLVGDVLLTGNRKEEVFTGVDGKLDINGYVTVGTAVDKRVYRQDELRVQAWDAVAPPNP